MTKVVKMQSLVNGFSDRVLTAISDELDEDTAYTSFRITLELKSAGEQSKHTYSLLHEGMYTDGAEIKL